MILLITKTYEIDVTHLSPMVSDYEILVLELCLSREFLKIDTTCNFVDKHV